MHTGACMSVYSGHGGQKRVLDSLELELLSVVNEPPNEGAGNSGPLGEQQALLTTQGSL